MNAQKNKPLASQLTHRIFTVYLAFAIPLMLAQLYVEFVVDRSELIGRTNFSILLMLITFIATTAGLWFIIRFFGDRLITRPLREFTQQIQSLNNVDNLTTTIDIGAASSLEFTHLKNTITDKQHFIQQQAEEELTLAKTRFLSAASHDLRQPMHALNLYLAAFKQLETSKPIQTCVDNLNKCAKAMNDMLDTLLDISNIDSGATQALFTVFPISSPIDRIQAEFEPLAREKGLTLRIARCSAFVNADEEIVERMLRLLVSNAVRYTERGKILIGCRPHGDQLTVTVYDTGIGIALDKQQAIFEEHFQLNNHERNRAKGLGLGLPIVRRLARLVKTSITLNSQLGRGSQFSFDLPRINPDTIQAVTTALHTMPFSHRPEDITIVVIDDEPLIRDATSLILECWGYTVITGMNGRDALEQLAKNNLTPDLIFCDFLLGDGENGIAIVTQLREALKEEIPAFLITGITSSDHIEAMHASGLPYMYKPLDHDKLRVALAQFTPLNYVR